MPGAYNGAENGTLSFREDAFSVPVLEFRSREHYNDGKGSIAQGKRYPNEVLIRGAAAGFTATIRDTKRMDFADPPLFSPFPGKKLGKGERDTAEAMTVVNSLVPEFLNCYLKGEGVFTADEIC